MIRQAIVLARGDGSERVAGLSLLERALRTLEPAGIDRVFVVGATAAGRSAITADPAFPVARLEWLDDAAGAALRERVEGPFVLVVADRVFDVATVRAASRALISPEVAVQRCVDRHGAEVGVYAAGTPLLDELRDHPLEVALGRLSERGRAGAIDIGDAFWRLADTPEARQRAETALFQALRKRTDGPVARWLNRPMSLFVTRRLVNTRITPNQMTIVANLVGAIGIVLVFQATWATVVVGALLVHLQSVLDGCDGEMARLKFKSSKVGEWLDNVLDDQINLAYGIALGYAASVLTGHPIWQWIGLGSGIAFFLHNLAFYAQLAFVHRSGNPFLFRWWFEKPGVDVTAMVSKGGIGMQLGGALRSLIRRDLFLFAFFGLALAKIPQVAVTWYALIAASQFILMLLHLVNGGAPASSRATV